MRVDPRFTRGLKLFQQGEYFQSHEVIEELWLETPKTDLYRDLYQGVIQAAAAVYQYDRKIFTGARGLAKSAIGYLEQYPSVALGCDVETTVARMQKLLMDLEKEKF